MHRGVVGRIVTLGAECVPLRADFAAVGVVAVGTANAFGRHAALEEGTMDVDFTQDLAVRVVEIRVQEFGQVGVVKGKIDAVARVDRASS
jgi:hypothetical protein